MMTNLRALVEIDPGVVASQILDAHPDSGWLDELMHELSAGRTSGQLANVLDVWDLSQAEFAGLMGVSRQAVGKWLDHLPADRAVAIADLAAATEVLEHYVRRSRIAAVVRRGASALGDRALVDLVADGDTGAVLLAVREMFDPAGVAG